MFKHLSFLILFSFSSFSYASPRFTFDTIENTISTISYVAGALISMSAIIYGLSVILGAFRK